MKTYNHVAFTIGKQTRFKVFQESSFTETFFFEMTDLIH